MNFTNATLMPLIARIIIATAMLTSGWVNCFGQVEIRSGIAEDLRLMDVQVNDPTAEVTETEVTPGNPENREVEETEVAETPVASGNSTTRGVNRIVWLLHDTWPELGGWGALLAWATAVSQLLAGVLLCVGFFTRIAALTVCIATGMAVFIISGTMHGMFSMNPFDWPLDSHRFIQLFAGLGLCALSLGLLVGGGGRFSLDKRYAASTPTKVKDPN